MKTISTSAQITEDGILHVEVPCDLPPGSAEVVLVLQSSETSTEKKNGPPYKSLHGIWAGKLPDIDIEEDLQEMNQQWKNSLETKE